jgi:hypothetical protein
MTAALLLGSNRVLIRNRTRNSTRPVPSMTFRPGSLLLSMQF